MCGRFTLAASPEVVAEFLGLEELEAFPPRYNIAPTQPILMAVNGPANKRQGILVRWGLVPTWVKDPADFTLLINARSETAATKPSFRNAMRHRRTLVPATGFFEWHRPADKKAPKQAYLVKPRNGEIVTFGGLMETWHSADGAEIDSGCILTCESNPEFAQIHHRMPVVIKPEDHEQWLDCMNNEPRDIAPLMQPVEEGFFEAIAVSDKVNKVANSGPDILEPVKSGDTPSPVAKPRARKSKPDTGDGQFDLF
ncbi:MAG: SOS response-associated peptidase [Rhizobiaceae bacterium]